MLKELKETMSKELNESMRTMSHQIENINKEIRTTKRNEIEILELKITINKMKKFTRGSQ